MKPERGFPAKLFAYLLILILTAAFLMLISVKQVCAEKTEAGNPEEAYNKLMEMENQPPSDWESTLDPYGYGEGNDFFLCRMQELMVYRHQGVKDQKITSYDTLKKANDEYPLEDAKYTRDYKVTAHNTLSFARTVAFDPTGSGRKDHIAVLGVYNEKIDGGMTDVFVYVMDKKNRTSEQYKVGSSYWMSNDNSDPNDNMWDFNAMNFLSITAGDYNGDGKESLAVYACCSSPILCTIDVKVTDEEITLSADKTDGKLLHHYYSDSDDHYVDNRLHCALDTGDVNGDGIDDLAVLSYVAKMTRENGGRSHQTYFYLPSIMISYGIKGSSKAITRGEDATGYNYVKDKEEGQWRIAPMAAGLSVGDLDGDGTDEITVAGFYHEIQGYYGSEVKDAYYKLDTSRLVVAVYDGKLNRLCYDTEISSNKWTRGGDVNGGLWKNSDDSYQQTAVETVAIDGRGSAQHLFINGNLYVAKKSNGKFKLSCVYEPDFFQEADKGTGGAPNAETYFRSTAVGVFDGNEEGREQIVYVLGAAASIDTGHVTYSIGMLGGIYEDDGKPTDRAVDFYSTDFDAMESNYYPESHPAYCTAKTCLSFDLCAWDCDSDGLHVKYAGKDYTYTDPDVMAVLQAPPYFKETKGALGSHSTAYSVSISYGGSEGKGMSDSWGVGIAYDVEAAIVKIHTDAGYAGSWSEKFTKSWSRKHTYTFYAYDEDQVVLCRTPVTIYHYQVERDGVWSDENILSLSFPGAPAKMEMSLEKYNAFAAYYNKKNKDRAKEINEQAKATVIKEEDIPQLAPVDDQYMGHVGDPSSYMMHSVPVKGRIILQDDPNSFTVGSSATGYSFNEEHSESKTDTSANGFTFNFSFQFTWGKSDVYKMALGVKASEQFMEENTSSTVSGTGVGVACTVSNMDPEKLSQLGISQETAGQYGFDYQMVAWPSGIVSNVKKSSDGGNPVDDPEWFVDFGAGGEKKYVPIYGYMLSNVKKPATVLDAGLEVDDQGKKAIRLIWSDSGNDIWAATGYDLLLVQKDEMGADTYTTVATLPADTKEYLFDDIKENRDYRFVLRSKTDIAGAECVDSNETYHYLGSGSAYLIELTSIGEEKDTYTVMQQDGTTRSLTVNHGAKVNSVVQTASNADVTKDFIILSFNDGTSQVFTVANGKSKADPSDGSTEKQEETKPEENKEKPVNAASLSSASLKLGAGKKKTLSVRNGTAAGWTSSDATVATVKGGTVTALKKGTADIKAILADGSSLTCRINVTSNPVLKTGGKTLKAGKVYKIKKGRTLTIKIKGKAEGVGNSYTPANKKIARVTSKKTAKTVKIKGFKKGRTKVKIKVNGVVYAIKLKVI